MISEIDFTGALAAVTPEVLHPIVGQTRDGDQPRRRPDSNLMFELDTQYGKLHTLEFILGVLNVIVFSVDAFSLLWDLTFFANQNFYFGYPSFLTATVPFVVVYIKIWVQSWIRFQYEAERGVLFKMFSFFGMAAVSVLATLVGLGAEVYFMAGILYNAFNNKLVG